MEPQAFELLMRRFDVLEEQNLRQLELLDTHVSEDNKVHAVVERHSIYWKAMGLPVPIALAYLATKLGLK